MSSAVLDRVGDWIDTVGGPFWPRSPRLDDIKPGTIAHALSNLCRFGGHTRVFYIVAQHSVLCAQQVPADQPRLRLEALLHDAAEAFVVDLPTPIKGMLPDYHVMEAAVSEAVARRFNLPLPVSDAVKEIDRRMLVTEASQLMMGKSGRWWADRRWPAPYPITIDPWTPQQARWEFLLALAPLWTMTEASGG